MKMLTSAERTLLEQLELSKRAIVLYEFLLKHKSLTARQAATLTKELPSAEYRLFKQLETLGMVRRGMERPITFTVIPKDVGLKAAYVQFRNTLEQVFTQIGSGASGQHHIEIIMGRQALYDKYIELAERSQSEICIYASVSPTLQNWSVRKSQLWNVASGSGMSCSKSNPAISISLINGSG